MKLTSILTLAIVLNFIAAAPTSAETFEVNSLNSTGEPAENAKLVVTSEADLDMLVGDDTVHFNIPGFYWTLKDGRQVIPGPGFTRSDGRSIVNLHSFFAKDNPKKTKQVQFVFDKLHLEKK
jgi:hypothetical protein